MKGTKNLLHPKGNWWRRAVANARSAIARFAAIPPDNVAIPRPQMLDCMELEDRVLFSAAPMAMAIAPHGTASDLGHVYPLGPQLTTANRHDPSPHMAGQHVLPSQQENNVVLIDSQLTDSAQLIADVAPNTKVFVYNSQRDTAQEVLHRVVDWAEATGSQINDLAILSHGVGGAFELGNQWITATSLAETAPAWQELSRVLALGANIEIFGCNVAAPGSDGQNLLNSLASVTHAAVFASTDTTGAGGNWQLEAASAGTSPAALSASSVPLNTALLASYGGVLGTIAIDTTSSSATASGGASSLTFSHTVNSGSNSILIIEVGIRQSGAGQQVTSITYGGESLTKIGAAEVTNNDDAEIWYLLAPAVGTANVVVTVSASSPVVANATDYFGVNQTTPFGTLVTATGDSATPSVAVASAAGQLVIDSLVTQGRALSIAPTGTGQIRLWSQATGHRNTRCIGGGSYQAGASSVTMSWTETSAHNWAIAAVPLLPAPVNVLTVDTTSDVVDGNTSSVSALLANPGPDGHISLREAILAADNTVSATPITIDFDIPGSGIQTINLLSALPQINDSMTLDATSQPGYSGTPLIQINAAGLGSLQNAIVVTADNTTVEGFSIYGTPDGNGIEIAYANDAVVQANYLGLKANGTIAGNGSGVVLTGATDAIIGGTSAADRNVISGNTGQGVRIESGASGNVVEGNYIGTDPTGSTSAGNLTTGIQIKDSANNTIGGTVAGAGNVISGNSGLGIEITGSASTDNFVYGNLIGTDVSGTAALGNSASGVKIDTGASSNTIGGIAAGQANIIAYNGGIGVEVLSWTATGDAIEGNSIYGNSGLGIDLGGDGVTPNDPYDWGTGPNESQSFPVLASAVVSGTNLSITGTLYTLPLSFLNYKIDFYWSPTADPSGYGQAKTYIGSTNVTTDILGHASINATFDGVSVPVGAFVTATATDPSGNTSEFALNVVATTANHAPVLSGANNLNTINENPVANPGTLVSALIAGYVTDSDPGALSGIAVTAVDNTNGAWQYSTNGGSNWTNFGSPSASSALLLAADANTYVRFVPNPNWIGSVANGINFQAWDQTSGTAGGTADATANGGSSAFSSATASASITVNSVNQAPSGANNTVTTLENTAYTFAAADFGFSDPNDTPPNSLLAVKITTLPGAGTLSDNGVVVTAGQFVSVSDINSGKLVFIPATYARGAGYASFTFQVQDNGGTANGGVNLDPTPNTMTVNVTPVNQAPVVAVPGSQNAEPTGVVFSAATGNSIAISDVDAGNGRIQVTLTATNGVITLARTQGLTLDLGDGQQDAQIVMTGTLADINVAMNGVLFRPTAQSAQLEVVANDMGFSGLGGPKTGSGTVGITEVLIPPPPSPPVVSPSVPSPAPIAPRSQPQAPATPAVAPAVPPAPPSPNPNPPTTKQSTAAAQHMPAARISLNVSVPQSSVQAWSLEIPLSRAADAKTWTEKSARFGKPFDANSSVSAGAELSDVAQGSPLWNDLNVMDQEVMSQVTTQELVVGTALTVSTGFTVGYVIWILRGGMLLTSLLAQMPAWRLIDPLVVLSETNKFENDGEQETLETIVDSLEDRPVEPAAEEEILV